ncbi:hypothetical protein ACF0H5_013713 [Mactra antiquata]
MNAIFVLSVFMFFNGIVAGPECESGADCGANECCLSNSQPRGRRAAFVRGTCQSMGTEGSKCIVNEISTGFNDVYYDCPCNTGYYCNGTGMMVLNKGELGVCNKISRVDSPTLDQPCTSGADCADTECCVSDVRPLGKRDKRQSFAHCKAMGVVGQGCLVSMGSGKPSGTVYACPCGSGLTCHGTGFYDIPLGESYSD